MFIQIKHEKKEYIEYINIFKIISVKSFNMVTGYPDGDVVSEHDRTAISYSDDGRTCTAISYEPVKDFMRRLRKETKEATEGIKERFEIMDL